MLFERIRPSLQIFAVKPVTALLLLAFQTSPHPEASPKHLRYERVLHVAPATSGQVCAVLDAAVLNHASPSLKDLRIYSGDTGSGEAEVPYAITVSEPLQQDTEDARILNLGSRSGQIVFDLEMPDRPYTAVVLKLAARDFIATAHVSGSQTLAAYHATDLGSFTLFDLSSQNLSHSTTLPLAETTFRYLHVELSLSPAPGTKAPQATASGLVEAASVPPSREAQTLYTTIARTSSFTQRGRQTVATFRVPKRVPIESIEFRLNPAFKGNFSRTVVITARTAPEERLDKSGTASADSPADATNENFSGTISHVNRTEAGRDIAYQSLSILSAIGSNMQREATVEVAINNGDDAPLPIAELNLQMRQRRICFDKSAAGFPLTLFYGDSDLEAPVYDYAKLFRPEAAPAVATMAPETTNPGYVDRGDSRPFTERHPELLWIVLLAVVCILALTALRSGKKLAR